MTMTGIYILTGVLVVVSLIASPGKTGKALKIATNRFLKITPAFLVMLMLVAISLYLLPNEVLSGVLADRENKWISVLGAMGLGSVSIMPGFIAFPLCGYMQQEHHALFMVLSAFSTSVMIVGVVTFPMEKEYLGTKLTVVRNLTSLLIALAIAIATGFVYGELP